ncbi:MAG TPA: DNA-directed RNA polymerase subunit K [Candidatus Nanoarchaeia archaeon]|nr:DNA-directed RNA polymerase subunit K [Candidatus Nanoarchaeia archaeon]
MEKKHTKYEIARMIGSRALQISMGAPFLVKLSEKDLEAIGYNPIEIAKLEYEKDLIPIAIRRPVPKKAKVEEKTAG